MTSGDWASASYWKRGGDWSSGDAATSDVEALKVKIEELKNGYWLDNWTDFMYWSSSRNEFVSSGWNAKLGRKGWWEFLWYQGTGHLPEKLAEVLQDQVDEAERGNSTGNSWESQTWESGNKDQWGSNDDKDGNWGKWSDNVDDWADKLDRNIEWHGMALVAVEKDFYYEHIFRPVSNFSYQSLLVKNTQF